MIGISSSGRHHLLGERAVAAPIRQARKVFARVGQCVDGKRGEFDSSDDGRAVLIRRKEG